MGELYANLQNELHEDVDTTSAPERRLAALERAGVETELAQEYLAQWPRGYCLQNTDSDVVNQYHVMSRLTGDAILVEAIPIAPR